MQCDVVAMDACHLLLGRPWQHDRWVVRNRHKNTYSFYFNNTKIVLLPNKIVEKITPMGNSTNLLSLARFAKEMEDLGHVYVLLGKEVVTKGAIPEKAKRLIEKFSDVFPVELPDELPPI